MLKSAPAPVSESRAREWSDVSRLQPPDIGKLVGVHDTLHGWYKNVD